jgi:hypothetical protein
VKPFFISMVSAPPMALSPKIGLLGTSESRRIDPSGMKSQLTTSP